MIERVSIIDYGVGNIHSIAKAFVKLGCEVEVLSSRLPSKGLVVLPGVGSFQGAMSALEPIRDRIFNWIREGRPLLGICVGMQVLFESSDEGGGQEKGLSVFPGKVKKMEAVRLPQIGWNRLSVVPREGGELKSGNGEPLPESIGASLEKGTFYFVNSYACFPEFSPSLSSFYPKVHAFYEYEGKDYPAVIKSGQVWAVQFHPEKSSYSGLLFLKRLKEHMMDISEKIRKR